jgi:hypothetical protein
MEACATREARVDHETMLAIDLADLGKILFGMPKKAALRLEMESFFSTISTWNTAQESRILGLQPMKFMH